MFGWWIEVRLLTQVLLWVICLLLLLSLAALLWQRRQTRRMLNTLNHMLDSAIDGTFHENSFDESLLSAVESRFNRYLTASVTSAAAVTTERARIKELISDISHQTKTPIANILLYTQLLEEQMLSNAGQEYVSALGMQAEKLSFLITSLVKLSRLESGVLRLSPVTGAIRPLLQAVVEALLPTAEQKQIDLHLEEGEDCRAVFDAKWTQEALVNLVDNAIKYTPSGGSVSLRLTAYELFVRVEVIDTGIGIAEEEHAKVFARFYRSPAVSDQSGVGIGLYLTRQILVAQGGYLKLHAEVGQGSTFALFLPRGN